MLPHTYRVRIKLPQGGLVTRITHAATPQQARSRVTLNEGEVIVNVSKQRP